MAEHDLTPLLAAQMERHLVFPLLEFLSGTNMVDYAMDIHKSLHGTDDVPEDMVRRRAEVVSRLRSLEEAAAPLVTFLQNPQLVQELRPDMQYNIHMLQERYQEQHSYKDPITEFLECLYVNYDFDGAQQKLMECEQSVDVSRCDHVTYQGLASLVDGRHFLQKLQAADCLHEIGQRFLSKLATLKETLAVLKLDGLEVSDSLLQAIGEGCSNLVEIGLSKCSGVADEGISSLVARCSDLRTIDLTCCNLITNNALDSIADNCKMLECLRLESCSLINEKGLKQIATCCPNLKEIDLTDCGVDDAELQHLAKCSELRILKLGLCSSISDKGIAFISSNCGKIVELDLYRCNSITDDGLAALAHGCKKIKLLNLCYCNKITDVGLGHLGSLEELTNLELRCLARITGIGISSIAIGCKSLIELDLKRCYSVDDAGLGALARNAFNLRQLTISYCQVTGLGLCQLLSSLRCLQDIKMVHLSWVSIEGFEMALRAACGRLKKLKMLTGLKTVLSPELLQMLQACGCRIRWVDKPLVYKDC